MSDPPRTAPALARFEELEDRLVAALAVLEDPEMPLEERLRLHARAAAIQKQLEEMLEEAQRLIKRPTSRPDKIGDTDLSDEREPYEAIRDRLARAVAELAQEDLPLGRVVALNRTARRLAARCEEMLHGARKRIDEVSARSPAPPSPARSESTGDDASGSRGTDRDRRRGVPPESDPAEDDDFVPF